MKISREFGNDIFEIHCEECNHDFIFYKKTQGNGIAECRYCSNRQKWEDIEKFADKKNGME